MDEIKFDKRNYRLHDDENKRVIKKSLKELGAGRSIVIDNEGEIIAGNGVYEQAKKLGIKTKIVETHGSELVVVKRTDLATGDDKRKRLALADNAASDTSEWAEELLREDWTQDVLADFGVVLPETDIQTENKEAQEDDFDEDKDKVETVCKKGDIWALGEHRLMCGDSTKPEDIASLMAGEMADLWLTDPPYNVDYVGKTKDALKINNDKMSPEQFREFLNAAFSAAHNVLVDGGAFYIWFASREYVNFELALRDVGLQVRQELIWNKNSLVMGRQDYQWKHEPCLYGWKDGAAHRWYSDRSQTTVIDWNRTTKSEEHPTMKPVGLFGYQIKNSSKPGDIVLDTFGGSGTTIIACEQLNRKARSMELDPHYCDVIIARWEKLTGNKATKINNN